MREDTVTLWRPVGPAELLLIEASGRRDAFNAAIVGEIEVTHKFGD